MSSSSLNHGGIGRSTRLSRRTSLFSTLSVPALQVRDVDFVRVVHFCTYQGTGVESRVGLASAPAMLLLTEVSIPPARRSLRPRRIDLESLALARSLPLLSPSTQHASRASASITV